MMRGQLWLMLRWCSIDAQIQDTVGMLSQPFLPTKAADSSIMGKCCQTAIAFAMMQGQQSVMLHEY